MPTRADIRNPNGLTKIVDRARPVDEAPREIPCIIIIRSWTGPPNCCNFAWTAASRRNQIPFLPVGICNIASPVLFQDTATLGLESSGSPFRLSACRLLSPRNF